MEGYPVQGTESHASFLFLLMGVESPFVQIYVGISLLFIPTLTPWLMAASGIANYKPKVLLCGER